MAISKHIGTIKVGSEEFRFVFDPESRGGCYSPALKVFRKGPNGSPAGIGYKQWPALLHKLFPAGSGWTNMLLVRLPYVSFARAYKLRRIGALKVYAANQRFYYRITR